MKRELTPIQREFQRRFAAAIPPANVESAVCECGCVYEDWDGGRMAHEVVFGHRAARQGGEIDG